MADAMTVPDGKTTLDELLARVEAGEEVVISRGGAPVARLVPASPKAKRQPGLFPDVIVGPEFFEPLPEEELRAWEGQGG